VKCIQRQRKRGHRESEKERGRESEYDGKEERGGGGQRVTEREGGNE
jgi:hypothetical protein